MPSSPFARSAVGAVAVLAAVFLRATPAAAQTPGWHGTADVNGNVQFGAARGRLAAFALGATHTDSAAELRGDAQLSYADADDANGIRSVTARSARTMLGVDVRPYTRVSPFAFGMLETSLQQRIAERVSGGGGAKVILHRHGDDLLDVSLALLGERTRSLPVSGPATIVTDLRGSARLRLQRRFGEGLQLTHSMFYQPVVREPSRYTLESNTALSVAMTKALALTATLRDRFDSQARARGARSDNDGQLLFGLRATY